MSNDYNKVIMIGRITQKPELRYTTGGSAVTTLRLASSRSYRTREGGDREETCFVNVEVWGASAENCCKYLVKGQRVLVEGRLNYRQWESEGKKRSIHEISAERVNFMEKPRGADSGGSYDKSDGPDPFSEDPSSDIPF